MKRTLQSLIIGTLIDASVISGCLFFGGCKDNSSSEISSYLEKSSRTVATQQEQESLRDRITNIFFKVYELELKKCEEDKKKGVTNEAFTFFRYEDIEVQKSKKEEMVLPEIYSAGETNINPYNSCCIRLRFMYRTETRNLLAQKKKKISGIEVHAWMNSSQGLKLSVGDVHSAERTPRIDDILDSHRILDEIERNKTNY